MGHKPEQKEDRQREQKEDRGEEEEVLARSAQSLRAPGNNMVQVKQQTAENLMPYSGAKGLATRPPRKRLGPNEVFVQFEGGAPAAKFATEQLRYMDDDESMTDQFTPGAVVTMFRLPTGGAKLPPDVVSRFEKPGGELKMRMRGKEAGKNARSFVLVFGDDVAAKDPGRLVRLSFRQTACIKLTAGDDTRADEPSDTDSHDDSHSDSHDEDRGASSDQASASSDERATPTEDARRESESVAAPSEHNAGPPDLPDVPDQPDQPDQPDASRRCDRRGAIDDGATAVHEQIDEASRRWEEESREFSRELLAPGLREADRVLYAATLLRIESFRQELVAAKAQTTAACESRRLLCHIKSTRLTTEEVLRDILAKNETIYWELRGLAAGGGGGAERRRLEALRRELDRRAIEEIAADGARLAVEKARRRVEAATAELDGIETAVAALSEAKAGRRSGGRAHSHLFLAPEAAAAARGRRRALAGSLMYACEALAAAQGTLLEAEAELAEAPCFCSWYRNRERISRRLDDKLRELKEAVDTPRRADGTGKLSDEAKRDLIYFTTTYVAERKRLNFEKYYDYRVAGQDCPRMAEYLDNAFHPYTRTGWISELERDFQRDRRLATVHALPAAILVGRTS